MTRNSKLVTRNSQLFFGTLWPMRSFALACLVSCGVLGAGCQQAASPLSPPTTQPPTPAADRLYVSDETGGRVVVIDPATSSVVATIAVGKRPRGLRVSPDRKELFVALSGSPIAGPGVDESKLPPPDRAADGIGVIDLASGSLRRTLNGGQDPESFDVSLDGKLLYVSNEEDAEASILDLTGGQILARVKVGEEPEGVTTRPDGRFVYVTSEGDNAVAAIDTATRQVVARMETGPRPRSVVFTPDSATAFVTAENGASVTVIDAAAHKVAGTIEIPAVQGAPTPPRPMGAVLSPDGQKVYVSLGRAGAIAVIDAAGRKHERTIADVGRRPWGIAVSADGRKLFTANGPGGDVSIVDVASGKVDGRIATGGSPWGIVIVRAQ